MKNSKTNAQILLNRSVEILEILADALPDPSDIPSPMLISINRFEKYVFRYQAVFNSHDVFCPRLLLEIEDAMKPLTKQRPLKSLLHLNRNEDTLDDFHRRLDEAFQSFMVFNYLPFFLPSTEQFLFYKIGSMTRTEVSLSLIRKDSSGANDVLIKHFVSLTLHCHIVPAC